MLHIALDELSRRGAQQVGAAQRRPRVDERQHVLQLIAESKCPARLIRTAARPDSAAQRLVASQRLTIKSNESSGV